MAGSDLQPGDAISSMRDDDYRWYCIYLIVNEQDYIFACALLRAVMGTRAFTVAVQRAAQVETPLDTVSA
ncbi:MAG: hypothetical protein HY866_15550 [Chloroflexi bacterium]|nr:hypothetical protein [Chloroflexota bacterium]